MEPEGRCEKGAGFTSLLTKEYMRRVRAVTTTLSVAFPAHCKPSRIVWSSGKFSGEDGGVGALWIILKLSHLRRNAGKIGKRWKKV